MPLKTIAAGFSGINNRVDPVRLRYDPKTGISPLDSAVNLFVDDTGRLSRRPGQVRYSAVKSHSVFCDKGDAFVVQDRTSDSAIYQIGTDYSLTGVVAGLVKGARVSFCRVGDKTHYMNGHECAVLNNGILEAWPGYTHVGVETLREFFPVPIGHKLAYFQDRMWVAVEDGSSHVIYVSEPFAVGKFRLAGCGFPLPSKVRMMKPVKNGVWVSDSQQTGFVAAGEKFEQMQWVKRSSFPAHEWSENIELVDLSQSAFEIPGLSAVWSSDAGLCIGSEDGQLIVATEQKLIYPTGGLGATLVEGRNVINSVY